MVTRLEKDFEDDSNFVWPSENRKSGVRNLQKKNGEHERKKGITRTGRHHIGDGRRMSKYL